MGNFSLLTIFLVLNLLLKVVASPVSVLWSPDYLVGNASSETLGSRDNAATIKVMIVGDSITQGREGDWTWRYRIWEWFSEQGIKVDFVGPLVGTVPSSTPGPSSTPPGLQDAAPVVNTDSSGPPSDSGGYAAGVNPNFDSDHFGAWGRQVSQDVYLIRGVVQTYQPDYLLVLLGFNDVGWFISDAEGTWRNMQTFVEEARTAKPDLKFALGNIPQRTFIGGRSDLPIKTDVYNQILEAEIPVISTPQSQIELVKIRENYECDVNACPAGYDGLHPNVLGEYQIAEAFSVTLFNSFSLGTKPITIPENLPARPISVPANVKAVSSPQGITVTWDKVYGARAYDIQFRLIGATEWDLGSVGSNRYDTTWVLDGWEMEFRVRMTNGGSAQSDWSPIVSAVCHPLTPEAPTNVHATATATGIDISWGAIGGAIEYALWVLDKDTVGAYVQIFGIESTKLSAHVDSLKPGFHYIVAVQAWNEYGGGFLGGGVGVTIGAGVPPAPTNLQVTSLDSTTVQLDWCGSHEAAGYSYWIRDINEAGSLPAIVAGSSVSDTSANWAWLFPGVWNYEFCVSAYNGDWKSAHSNCVVAPQPVNKAGGPISGANCYRGGEIIVGPGWGNPTPSCTSGTGTGNYEKLCIFGCSLGFCPPPCKCTSKGEQTPLPPSTGDVGFPLSGEDDGYDALCSFACSLGYCPPNACTATQPAGSSGGGLISLPESIWGPGPYKLGCNGSCTFIFPPSPLPRPEVINWPSLTTSLLSSSGNSIYTITTVISVPAFTITEINYWSVTVVAGDPTTAIFVPEQSVMPPGFILTLPGNEATFPPTPFPQYSNFKPVPTSSSDTTPEATFYQYPYGVTIQPQPTVLVSTPSPTTKFTYSSTSDTGSQPTCTSHCGSHNCGLFGCGTGCGIFGCGGGCGIFGCGGGCGVLGCGGGCRLPGGCGSTQCPLSIPRCSNPGCIAGCPGPPPGIGEATEGEDGEEPTSQPTSTGTKSCTRATATDYWISCYSNSCTTTSSAITVGCSVTASATTVGDYCPTGFSIVPDDGDDEVAKQPLTFGVISTATFAESVIIGGATYTVQSHSIVVSGTIFYVPTVTTTIATNLGGKPATIFPERTSVIFSVVPGITPTITGV